MVKFSEIPLGAQVSFTAYRRPNGTDTSNISGTVFAHFISSSYMDDIAVLSTYYRNVLPTIPAEVRKLLPSKVEEGVNFVSILVDGAIIAIPLAAIIPTTLKVGEPVLTLVVLTDTPEEDIEIVSSLYGVSGSRYVDESLHLILTLTGESAYTQSEVEARLTQRGFDMSKLVSYTVN